MIMDKGGERFFKVSEDALVLTLVNHIVTYISEDTPQSEKEMMQVLSGQLATMLYEGHKEGEISKDKILIIFLSFASKILELHELEVKCAETMLKYAESYDDLALKSIQKIIGMNTHDFINMQQEGQFQFLYMFIKDMGIDPIETYKELDMLEADVTNKPIFSH